MRTHSRSVLARTVATALSVGLALTVLLPSGALAEGNASSTSRSRAERAALALLDTVRAAYQPQARTPGTRLPYRDLTVALQQLKLARGDLPAAERAIADRYVARAAAGAAGPSNGCPGLLEGNVYATPDGHFCIHYKLGDEAYAQQVGDVFQYVWSVEIGTLGFRAPLSDGDGRLDVDITQDLGSEGKYGYCATVTSAAQSPAYCALDDDFDPAQFGAPAINSLSVTAAHEFFHAIQFAYNSHQETWAMEGTAVWAEDEVFPDINDYLQYVRFSPYQQPSTPIDTDSSYYPYGSVVFWKFLAEYLGDRGAIRSFWEYADAPAGRSALQAVVDTLAARGRAFPTTFAAFTAWNTRPTGSYTDGRLWPAPRYAVNVALRPRTTRMSTRAFTLDHLTGTALMIRPAGRLRPTSRLRVLVNGPSGSTSPQALIQVRMRSGAVKYIGVPLNGAGDGSRIVTFNRSRVVAVVLTLSNASLGGADGQPFYAAARIVR